MKQRIICIAATLLLALAAFANAEVKPGTISITPFVGGYTFDGKQHLETGPTGGIKAGYDIMKYLGIEAIFNYVPADPTVGGEANKGRDNYLYRAEGLIYLMPDQKLVPYLAVGGGLIQYKPQGEKSKERGLWDWGLGAKYFLSDSLALRGDVRHIIYYDKPTTYLAPGQNPRSENLQNYEYTVGLSFLFGGAKPAPKVVAAPAPPPAPAPAPAPQPVVAPAPKPVVVQPAPKCIITINPETVTQGQSATLAWSCRDATSHNIDPSIGAVSNEGSQKISPSASTTYTISANGPGGSTSSSAKLNVTAPAPEPVAAAPKAAPAQPTQEELTMTLMVEFDTAKSAIKAKYHNEIGRVAEFLKKYPEASGVIEGHTDNVGKAEMNLKLSQQRADSIRKYLIDKYGISPSRLTAKGYGMTKPIADNKTAAGRAKNRRTEAHFTTVTVK